MFGAGDGLSAYYPKQLELQLYRSIQNAKALLPDVADPTLGLWQWLYGAVGKPTAPILRLNLLCLRCGFNAVVCCGASILRFCRKKHGTEAFT